MYRTTRVVQLKLYATGCCPVRYGEDGTDRQIRSSVSRSLRCACGRKKALLCAAVLMNLHCCMYVIKTCQLLLLPLLVACVRGWLLCIQAILIRYGLIARSSTFFCCEQYYCAAVVTSRQMACIHIYVDVVVQVCGGLEVEGGLFFRDDT